MNAIKDEYIGLGEGKGMKIQLFPNRLVMQRMENFLQQDFLHG